MHCQGQNHDRMKIMLSDYVDYVDEELLKLFEEAAHLAFLVALVSVTTRFIIKPLPQYFYYSANIYFLVFRKKILLS